MQEAEGVPVDQARENDQELASNWGYAIRTLLLVFIGVPVLYQMVLALAAIPLAIAIDNFDGVIGVFVIWLLSLSVPVKIGYTYGKKARLPRTFWACYGPVVFPAIYTLLLWCVAMYAGQGMFTNEYFQRIVILGLLPFLGITLFVSFGGYFWILLFLPLAVFVCVMAGFAWGAWHRRAGLEISARRVLSVLAAVFVLGGVLGWQAYGRSQQLLPRLTGNERREVLAEADPQYGYQPFSNSSKLTPLRDESRLRIESDFPRLDGATAFFPVYAAAVQAIYKAPQTNHERREISDVVRSSRTPHAYRRLIEGEADLIFAAAPSKEQMAAAHERGLTLSMVPLAREAFVFLVNRQNPVKSLSSDQIRAIYAGQVNNWQDVGGEDMQILAFQRPSGSGSQSTMENKVMQGQAMREPLKEEVSGMMGGLVMNVADYRNARSALGYSFRYYVTAMRNSEQVQLLAIDGVEPTVDNIRNGSYAFIADVYMVTARPLSENTQKLMDWFLSDQGQQLIADVGYVPVVPVDGRVNHMSDGAAIQREP